MRNRRKELESFLRRALNKPVVCDSDDLRIFLLSDSEFVAAKEAKKEKLSSSILNSLSNLVLTGKAREVDEWFDQEKGYLNDLHNQTEILLNKFLVISKNTRDLGHAYHDIGQTSSVLSTLETHHDGTLSRWFQSITDVSQRLSENEKALADELVESIEDTLRDQLRFIESATTEALSDRDTDLLIYQNATQVRENRQERLHKNPSDQKARNEVNDAEAKETETRNQFYLISKILKEELSNFYNLKQVAMKQSLKILVQKNLDYHYKACDLWKETLQSLNE